jgi:hypothetical protein
MWRFASYTSVPCIQVCYLYIPGELLKELNGLVVLRMILVAEQLNSSVRKLSSSIHDAPLYRFGTSTYWVLEDSLPTLLGKGRFDFK